MTVLRPISIARWLSALSTTAVFSAALLECGYAHGYVAWHQLLCLTLLVWLTALASLFIIQTRVWPVLMLMALTLPFAAVETWLLVNFHAQLGGHALTVMIATDAIEARQYLSEFIGIILAVLLATVASVWAAWTLRHARQVTPAEQRAILPAAVVGWMATYALLWLWAPPELSPNNGDVVSSSGRMFERVFPWGLPTRLLSYSRELAIKRAYSAQAVRFRFNANAPAAPRVVMLVIGESSRASNWQLGGYARATNPRLIARGDVIWFQNYAANAVATALSVPLMVTRKPTEKGGDAAWPERSIVSAFVEAGYQTSWISNQATAGMHDVLIASYAQEAQAVRFINLTNHESQGAYDAQLLPEVEKQLNTGAARQFIVVHLMGSHYKYAERYPANEDYFGAAANDRNWLNSYDNSIRHTDRVLAELIALLERSGKPAALMYASDHGELLPSPTCNLRWHGYGAKENIFASALLWLSPHPENTRYARAVRLNAVKPTSSKDLFDSLAMAGDLTFPGQLQQNSWLSDRYLARNRAVSTFNGLANADASPIGACGMLPKLRM